MSEESIEYKVKGMYKYSDSEIVSIIALKFLEFGISCEVPLLKGTETFNAKFTVKGIEVNNLGNQPLLAWEVFVETIRLLEKNSGSALRGDAQSSKLGEKNLPIDSIEGHLAHVVYEKNLVTLFLEELHQLHVFLSGLVYVDMNLTH